MTKLTSLDCSPCSVVVACIQLTRTNPVNSVLRRLVLPLVVLSGLPAMAADSLHVTMQVSNYNGFQVSCFGEKDGWIDLSVSGGTGPYAYKWSNGAATQDINELAAGYYKVDVIDHDGRGAKAEVTLEQPLPMKPDVDVYQYSNGYNTSCYACSNGNASVQVLGGAPPFTISWSDGPTGANRYNLEAKDYKITVSDANGCAGASTVIYLRGPDRSDWSMSGNPGTTPGPQYIGTPDNKDVVFKSNAQELLRLKADGNIGIWGADTTAGLLYRDHDGTLKMGGGPPLPVFPPSPCAMGFSQYVPLWRTTGNTFPTLCPDVEIPQFGSLSNTSFNIITNDQMRMHFSNTGIVEFFGTDSTETVHISPNGQVGIGTLPSSGSNYRLFVEDGIATRDVQVQLGPWPDYVFQPGYALMPMDGLREFLRAHSHLPGIPSAAELQAKQGVELGAMQARLLKVVEEQALYILQLEEKQAGLEQRLEALENRSH